MARDQTQTEAEINALSAKINMDAIIAHAKRLTDSVQCRVLLGGPMQGFKLGEQYMERGIVLDKASMLLRVLRQDRMSQETGNQVLVSECATMKWLKENTRVPVPLVYGFALRGDPQNQAGDVAYMLVSRMTGRTIDERRPTRAQRRTVIRDWASMLCELSRCPWDKVGSLQFAGPNQDQIEVGPVASEPTRTLPCMGPFATGPEFYYTWASAYRDIAASTRPLTPDAADDCLMWLYVALRLNLAQSRSWLSRWPSYVRCYLKHVNDDGSHLLVDKNFRITGVINWTHARVVPAYEALAPSHMTATARQLCNGIQGRSDDDLVLEHYLLRRKSPYCFFRNDEMRRLMCCLSRGVGSMAAHRSRSHTLSAFRCLVATFSDSMETVRSLHCPQSHISHLIELLTARSRVPPFVDRLSTCSYSKDCGRPSVRGRYCLQCSRDLCSLHILPRHHRCSPLTTTITHASWADNSKTESRSILAETDVSQLQFRASALRQQITGHYYTCLFHLGPHDDDSSHGRSANHVGRLVFSDGVQWVARIPRRSAFADVPLDFVNQLVLGEYTTLSFLDKNVPGVPAPRPYGYGLFSKPDNPVKVGYILEEFMPGRPFDAAHATAEQTLHVHRQYAGILKALTQTAYPSACCLVQGPEYDVQGWKDNFYAGPVLFANGRMVSSSVSDPATYFASVANQCLDLIADGQMYPEYPREAFYFYLLLRDLAAPILGSCDDKVKATIGRSVFFLKHADDNLGHLLVDDHYNITAVLNWRYSRFVPACEAFGPGLEIQHVKDVARTGSIPRLARGLPPDFSPEIESGPKLLDLGFGGELASWFSRGLGVGLPLAEVLGAIRALQSLLGVTEDRDMHAAWMAVRDVRRFKVDKIVSDQLSL